MVRGLDFATRRKYAVTKPIRAAVPARVAPAGGRAMPCFALHVEGTEVRRAARCSHRPCLRVRAAAQPGSTCRLKRLRSLVSKTEPFATHHSASPCEEIDVS